MADEKDTSQQIMKFYFSNNWYSFFTIMYFLFFSYSALFYFDNIILAIKFLIYTVLLSTPLLGLNYLLWGTMFMIALIIPFSISIYAIFMLYDIWMKTSIQIKQKLISTVFATLLIVIIIISMDDIVRLVAKQEPLMEFVQKNELGYRVFNDGQNLRQ